MRHKVRTLRLNRSTSWRRATELSLVRNLLLHQSIKTTRTRALAARRLADKLISLAKENSLFSKRRAFQILGDHSLVSRLFKDTLRFSNRVNGYTRILSTGTRRGDGAEMVIFELTEIKKKEARIKKKKEAQPLKEEAPRITAPAAVEKEAPGPAEKPETKVAQKEKDKPPIVKKPVKGFLVGIRKIFKKERDSL